ncbi:hypothetical protein COCON_G00063830 [Conger conger]|uniref:protein-synthesizing GTPase n=1 Tax=Conger conger TaxID=82655 RepID=A0A9Q1I214_CONCO|nr:hypothetical protein COCON_G00063830 [Conger conger]
MPIHKARSVHLIELTIPREEGIEAAFERKKAKYSELAAECREAGWKTTIYPVEVGCRGYVGTIGHVAHGKSTVVKAISGVHTVRFKNELERNITIKLGYANAKVYKLDDPSCPRPECYRSCGSSTPDEFPTDIPGTKGNFKLVRHVSFVDCPGHDILMATMLNGAAVMDAALLLIAGNESCPQPQTSEHLAAIEIMKLKHILILQNKIDLVKESQAKEQYEQILAFVQGTVAEGAPIIPISAQLKYNIEVVCEYIVKKIPVPLRDFTSEPRLIVIRSFDVNKPGCEVDDLKGGVAGGSILKGVLKVGQELEVRPGIVSKDHEGKLMCKPIFSKIVSLFAEHNDLQYAAPGGLIGVGTKIDPTLCRADRMVGQVLGAVGALPEIFTELEISYFLLRRLLGVRTEGDKKAAKVQKLSKNEVLMVNIGSLSTGGRVSAVKADLAKIVLTSPVCTEVGEKIALSRRVEKHWRVVENDGFRHMLHTLEPRYIVPTRKHITEISVPKLYEEVKESVVTSIGSATSRSHEQYLTMRCLGDELKYSERPGALVRVGGFRFLRGSSRKVFCSVEEPRVPSVGLQVQFTAPSML